MGMESDDPRKHALTCAGWNKEGTERSVREVQTRVSYHEALDWNSPCHRGLHKNVGMASPEIQNREHFIFSRNP